MTRRLPLGNFVALLLPLTAGAAPAPDFQTMNAAFGLPLWADGNLWDDSDDEAGKRLNWPPESRTATDSSLRLYAGPDVKVLGARPYSLAFYGRNGLADRLSMVFANKGDIVAAGGRGDFRRQISLDASAIEKTLSRILGPPRVDQIGKGTSLRERVERWDWNGHSILLAAPPGQYVAVRIVPSAQADAPAAPRISARDMSARLEKRVARRSNGDVILEGIPMVDQGPKGYCVPATWERALRYMDIPADMYVLAMAAQTDAEAGTDPLSMANAVNELVLKNGRGLISAGGWTTPQAVARYIDEGLPILWGRFVDLQLEENLTARASERRKVSDWAAYGDGLKVWRKDAGRIRIKPQSAHLCLIIGYNQSTGELCISDSQGPEFAERWITGEEATRITMGDFTVIGK